MDQQGRVLIIDYLDARKMEEYTHQGMSLKSILEQEQHLYSLILKGVNEVRMPAEFEEKYPQLKQRILTTINEM
ncbi:hypothetical protein BSK66_31205 [Paenibacillus odorifer]|uniref:Uncharacterized protein n=1 Tax=Paenibacillus odorifer TaxID=189426 RepID=A0A1R0X047_9BACL|nr:MULTISPECIES: hypothetical protein [Paenibacillus]ETT55204.1 hypothetical protein C171_19492 [Paenibacillus sp. FSL H8-237]OMD25457.1 hypothetical protein BJP51_04210 [Paenibacillus odorifer]OME46911.1 hypothetical protein BSK66_31205 [Paenibacillus odorifer]